MVIDSKDSSGVRDRPALLRHCWIDEARLVEVYAYRRHELTAVDFVVECAANRDLWDWTFIADRIPPPMCRSTFAFALYRLDYFGNAAVVAFVERVRSFGLFSCCHRTLEILAIGKQPRWGI